MSLFGQFITALINTESSWSIHQADQMNNWISESFGWFISRSGSWIVSHYFFCMAVLRAASKDIVMCYRRVMLPLFTYFVSLHSVKSAYFCKIQFLLLWRCRFSCSGAICVENKLHSGCMNRLCYHFSCLKSQAVYTAKFSLLRSGLFKWDAII